MDPVEIDSWQHFSPGADKSSELGFQAPADPDPEPTDHQAAWDEVDIVRKELEGHLHLEEAKGEEEKGYDGNFNCDYNGWDDWGDGDKIVVEENNWKEADWGVKIEEVEDEEKEVGARYYNRGQRSIGDGFEGVGKYPVRLGAEDCSFYMKTGTCKFGSGCKFNHPVKARSQPAKDTGMDWENTTEKLGQLECKYYLRSGGCKYGDACRFSHAKVKAPVSHDKASVYPVAELNFLNLPIRPGEKECPYYMRNGSCKYGANCRFNHPNPSAGGVSESISGFNNGASPSVYPSSKPTASSWSLPRPPNDAGSFVPMMFSPPQAIPQTPEWNGYSAPAYSQERGMLPTYSVNNLPTESNVYGHYQQLKQVDEFPERPGQPDCSYFLKTGDCKFKSNCRYHHPKNRNPKPPPCALSDKGLPLRPDQNICAYYSRYGICKFGPACKFNHPIQEAPVGSTEDQPPPFYQSSVDGVTRI